MRTTNRPLTVIAVLLAMAMGALEMTVVSTVMPTVIADLGGITHYAWVFTAYMLTSTVSVPIYGKLADLYGRKPMMQVGIALFLIGSILSGQSRTMTQLIAFRALQGLGAGAMQPLSLTIIGDIYSVEQRAKMQGIFGAVWGLSGLAGPLVGGLIVKYLSWHWVFYINVPVGLGAALVLQYALVETIDKQKIRLDVLGAVVLSAAVVLLLFGSSRGGSIWLLLGAAAAFAAFITIERAAPEPLIPLDLFKQRVIAVSSIAGGLVGGAMVSTITYVPLYVQGVLGGSPTDAGSAITPMVVGWPIAAALGGLLLPKVGFRPLIRGGFAIVLASAIGIAFVMRPGVSIWAPRLLTTGIGVGLGFANTALFLAVQSSVSWNRRGVATASSMFFRTIGATIAVGVLGGILAAGFARTTVPPEIVNQLMSQEKGKAIDPAMVQAVSSILDGGLRKVFVGIAILAAAALFASLLFPPIRLEGMGKDPTRTSGDIEPNADVKANPIPAADPSTVAIAPGETA